MPELWEVLIQERSTNGTQGGAFGTDRPRWEPAAPQFGTTGTPGYRLDESGQYVPDDATLAAQRRAQNNASMDAAYRASPAGFLEDIKTGFDEAVPMNAAQWGMMRAGQKLQNAPLPLGIGEDMGKFIEMGATGRATRGQFASGLLDAVNFVPLAWGVQGTGKALAAGAKNVSRQLPKGAKVRGEHLSPKAGLDHISPDMPGTNPRLRGAESSRPQVSGSYWNDAGIQATPEAGLGPHGYRADLSRVLMPGTAAQNKIRAEATRNVRRQAEQEAKRTGGKPIINKDAVAYEFERLVDEKGYYGYAADTPAGRVVKYFNTAEPDQLTQRVVNRPTADNIARHIRDNPEGGSIYPNTGTAPASGIAVAQRGAEQVVEGTPSAGTLTAYMGAQAARGPGADDMIGWWGNQGNTYLDRSRIASSPLGGRLAGEMNYQKAVYDVGKGEEIPMTVRPLVEGYADWRKGNAAQAGGGMFGQRGAVGDLKAGAPVAPAPAAAGEADLFGRAGNTPNSRSMRSIMSDGGEPSAIDASRTVYKGKPVTEWTPKDFEGFGAQYGVTNLGPLTPYKKVAGFDIPGGTEGKFTYYDLMDMKSRGIDPNSLPPAVHAELQQKLSRTMTPEANNPVQVFNRYLFGLLSPNQPLTPNEFEAIRLFTRSPADIKRLGKFIDWNPGEKVSAARRKAAELEMVKFFNTNSAGTGGLGLKGTADYTNIAELAKMFEKNPEWFTRRSSESWENFLDRVQSQVRGATSKVGSFATVWQEPGTAGISAIDRHMIQKFREEAFTPAAKINWEKGRVPLWNKAVEKRRVLDKDLKAGRVTKAEHQKAVKMLPGSGSKKVRKYSDIKGQPNATAWDDSQLMSYITRAKTGLLRTKAGEVNQKLPEHLRTEAWVAEPEKVVMIGDQYRAALGANRAEAAKHDLGLFESQWMLWDRIRNRLEPHEVMFPGLEKLPPMHQDELKAALKTHSNAGYLSTGRVEGKGQRHVRPMPPAGAAYWGAAGAGVLANEYEKGLTPGKRYE